MKIKQIIPAVLACATVVACNGGGNSGPAADTAQYGKLVSASEQKLINLSIGPLNLSGSSYLAAGLVAAIVGNYVSSDTASIITYVAGGGQTSAESQQANNLNTNTIYNYSPFQKFIANNMVDLNNPLESITSYAIKYTTPGQNSGTQVNQIVRTASGMIIMPSASSTQFQNIKGVVIYFHPTSFGKNEVPSCLGPLGAAGLNENVSTNLPDYCNVAPLDNVGIGYYASLAATYVANGYIVLAPDYLGQGADYDNYHPYVAYPEVNALSAFNMLPSLREILATKYNIPITKSLPLFLTGYSEGGGYALKASQMAQTSQSQFLADNGVHLVITSPQEGAYSLPDQMDFAFADLKDGYYNCSSDSTSCGANDMMNSVISPDRTPEVKAINNWNIGSAATAALAKPGLTSYVLTAAMEYSFHNIDGAYNFAMEPNFWSGIPMPDSQLATLAQLFSGEVLGSNSLLYSGSIISSAIVTNTFNVNGYDPVSIPSITLYKPDGTTQAIPYPPNHYGTNNSGLKFIKEGVEQNPAFQTILKDGSTYNWTTNSPINFIHMNYDSMVTVLNTHQAYSCMKTGTSYAGISGSLIASSAVCSAGASGNLIESTIIPNFQLTNNAVQLTPMASASQVNPLANSKFWTGNPLSPQFGTPYDHGDILVLGNIIALCSFENALQNNTNSGICPQ